MTVRGATLLGGAALVAWTLVNSLGPYWWLGLMLMALEVGMVWAALRLALRVFRRLT